MNNIQNISGYLPPEWIDAWKGQAETDLPLTWEDPDNMYQLSLENQKSKKKCINCSEIP